MSHIDSHHRLASRDADPRLALLRGWLSIGTLLLVLLPPASWHNHSIGWLPYWLLVAPLISLALLRRHRLAAALSAFLVRGRRRRNLAAVRVRRAAGLRVARPARRAATGAALIRG